MKSSKNTAQTFMVDFCLILKLRIVFWVAKKVESELGVIYSRVLNVYNNLFNGSNYF